MMDWSTDAVGVIILKLRILGWFRFRWVNIILYFLSPRYLLEQFKSNGRWNNFIDWNKFATTTFTNPFSFTKNRYSTFIFTFEMYRIINVGDGCWWQVWDVGHQHNMIKSNTILRVIFEKESISSEHIKPILTHFLLQMIVVGSEQLVTDSYAK